MRRSIPLSLLLSGLIVIGWALYQRYRAERDFERMDAWKARQDQWANDLADENEKKAEAMTVDAIVRSMERQSPSTSAADKEAKQKVAELQLKEALNQPTGKTSTMPTQPASQ